MSDLPPQPEIPTVKQEPRGFKAWFFTWNNPTVDGATFKEMLIAMRCTMAKFQLEKCPTTGTPHFQGGAKWDNAMRGSTLTKRFPGIYLERLGDWTMVYGTKDDTRIDGPWAIGCVIPEPLRVFDKTKFRPWQKKLYDELSVPSLEDRKIYWVWERHGNVGKTTVMKALRDELGEGSVLRVDGDPKDIAFAIRQVLKPLKGPVVAHLRVVVVDLERMDVVPYDILGKLKDGWLFSPKYESVDLRFNPPHVVCVANFPPDESRISADRWIIIEV